MSHSQGANGPASMPTRSKLTPVALNNAAMLSGSVAAFAHDPALVVDDADRRLFHRDVKADIIPYGCPPQAVETRLGGISDPVQASLEGSRLPVTPLPTRSPITPSPVGFSIA
jgi:hypothetical protein